MKECFFCETPEEKVKLYSAVHKVEGLVYVCGNCAFEEHLPIVRKPNEKRLEQIDNKDKTVYERLSKTAGIDPDKHQRRHEIEKELEDRRNKLNELSEEELELKEIINKNLQSMKETSTHKKALIENFHWIIMRARRRKHLSQDQLAEKISEPKVAIELAEKGILPEDDSRIIKKLEDSLGIVLREDMGEIKKSSFSKKLSFEMKELRNLTISDLRELKKKREESVSEEN